MAIFRKIHTSFWSDTFIQDLDNDHKLFYLYLLTNERTKQCGIYEISKKQISFDLGYSIDRVSKLLKYFIDTNRIMYSEPTKELALRNWTKFNGSTSPKVVSCIKSELLNVKDTVLIEYVNGMYTASQEEQEQEEEEQEEEIKEIYSFDEFWSTYDKSIGKKNCKAKFEKLSDEVKLKIKEVLPLYVQSTHDKQFRKHPITWLNQECWNDDVKTIMKEETVEEMNDRMLYENVMKKINMYHAKD